VAPVFNVLTFQVAFGGFKCFLIKGVLTSSTSTLVLVAFEGFVSSIYFKSLLTNSLGSATIYSSSFAFNNVLFNK
jgi:hypothetical protein